MPTVRSEPHAHLRLIYRRLTQNRAFALVSTETQFAMLVEAVAGESEDHAALMRLYIPAARAALIDHLSRAERQRRGEQEVTLWTASKAQRRLTCVAVYLPHGVDVRLLEGQDLRRTQLRPDGPRAEQIGAAWRAAALRLGWIPADEMS